MSLPPELRTLCFHLSNTPTSDLPRLTPILLHHVSRCHSALSSPVGNASKAEASGSSIQVQVHKLKTQISTLLNGRSPDGRFVAVLLIKAVVEIGGWEVLRGSEAWVRGLLSILGKPESPVTKELCIIALTKIYCMTHPYQTLVREITTPTLPAFVTSCLNLLSSKSSAKSQSAPSSTIEIIFGSFATLLPRHTTIYRPFISQIRAVTKPYLASTMSGGVFVSSSLAESARRLVVSSHLTVAKSGGGEEWGKAVRDIVRNIHVTADLVLRAILEDWESNAGYVPAAVDFNIDLCGGAKDGDDLPRWTGIDAGVERLTGLLALLGEYFENETSQPVSIPLGAIFDSLTRMLSVAIPPPSQSSNARGAVRLHPAVDSDEKAGLWAGMPQIYVAALQVACAIAERLQEGFLPLAEQALGQLGWIFPSGKHDSEFRAQAYRLNKQLLHLIGSSLSKQSSVKCAVIIRSCCNDLVPLTPKPTSILDSGETKVKGTATQNVDTFLQASLKSPENQVTGPPAAVRLAASELLPLFLSHFPQKHLDISLRSLVERTSILTQNHDALLASILNPFVGKNGRGMTPLLPHLSSAFPHSQSTELLLRPRMPLVPVTGSAFHDASEDEEEKGDEDMDVDEEAGFMKSVDHTDQTMETSEETPVDGAQHLHPGLGASSASAVMPAPPAGFGSNHFSASITQVLLPTPINPSSHDSRQSASQSEAPLPSSGSAVDARKFETAGDMHDASESEDESVHLNMELDTDSEDEDDE